MGMGLSKVKHVIGVLAGKGGVGKSTLCLQIARAFQVQGWRVGILDADVHGPSMQRLAPPTQKASLGEVGVVPAQSAGIKVMSVAYLPNWGEAAIIRAPIANALIAQFLEEVEWGELDLLLVDFPPGTGDIPITLLQRARLEGVVAVSTPQSLAQQDVRKALLQTKEAQVPVLGFIENMAGLALPDGRWMDMFGPGNAEGLISEFQIPLFCQLTFDPQLSACSEWGGHLFEAGFDSVTADELAQFSADLGHLIGNRAAERCSTPSSSNATPSECRVWIEEEMALRLCARDGSSRRIDVDALQLACPCVLCRENRREPSGSLFHAGRRTRGELRIRQLRQVGAFGVALEIEGGCSRGIFPYSLLEQLGSVCVADG